MKIENVVFEARIKDWIKQKTGFMTVFGFITIFLLGTQGVWGFAQDPGNPELDLLPCRLLLFRPDLPHSLQALPFFSPEKTKTFHIKRLVFQIAPSKPQPNKTMREFRIQKDKLDTVHVLQFDKEGNLIFLRSRSIHRWLRGDVDPGATAQWREQIWSYDSAGVLRESQIRETRGDGNWELKETWRWEYSDTSIICSGGDASSQVEEGKTYSLSKSGRSRSLECYQTREGKGGMRFISSGDYYDFHYGAGGQLRKKVGSSTDWIDYTYGTHKQLIYRRSHYVGRGEKFMFSEQFQYDSHGNLISWDKAGTVFNWEWDQKGLPQSHSFPLLWDKDKKTKLYITVEFWN